MHFTNNLMNQTDSPDPHTKTQPYSTILQRWVVADKNHLESDDINHDPFVEEQEITAHQRN